MNHRCQEMISKELSFSKCQTRSVEVDVMNIYIYIHTLNVSDWNKWAATWVEEII